MATVELEVPARSVYVGVVRLAIASLARAAELDEEVVDDIKIAVSEACTNAVLSHEANSRDDPVTIAWDQGSDRILIEVGDRGPSYDPRASEGSDTQSLRLALSVALLESLVDGCDIEAREGGGMSTRLYVNRAH